MIGALSAGLSGMQAQVLKLDAITHNLANINTTSFKKSRVNFQDQPYLKTASGQAGLGVSVGSIDKIFSSGNFTVTENQLDLTIEGDGFFQVTLPDNTTAYTRDGTLRTDGQGRIVNSNGYILNPEIVIPQDTTGINISSNGVVSVNRPGFAAPQVLGRIQLVKFANPAGLTSLGQNLYSESANSGVPMAGIAGSAGYGKIQQGFLEMSNVDMSEEMAGMILAQRAYQANIKSVKTADEMLETLFDILR